MDLSVSGNTVVQNQKVLSKNQNLKGWRGSCQSYSLKSHTSYRWISKEVRHLHINFTHKNRPYRYKWKKPPQFCSQRQVFSFCLLLFLFSQHFYLFFTPPQRIQTQAKKLWKLSCHFLCFSIFQFPISSTSTLKNTVNFPHTQVFPFEKVTENQNLDLSVNMF